MGLIPTFFSEQTKPFPNMPLGFWGDEGNVRYRAAYYEAFKEPVWTQGDWIAIHSLTGGVTVFGRYVELLFYGFARKIIQQRLHSQV